MDSVKFVLGPGDDAVSDLLWGGDGFDICIMGPGDRAVGCEDVTIIS